MWLNNFTFILYMVCKFIPVKYECLFSTQKPFTAFCQITQELMLKAESQISDHFNCPYYVGVF